MKVRVLYFASARELASTSSETVTLPGGSTVRDLSQSLTTLHPALRKLARSVNYSVNRDVAASETKLEDGDEVGVLPPVAGG